LFTVRTWRHIQLPLCLAALAGVALVAYGNAMTDALVFDDQNFFPYDYSFSKSDVADFFTKDTWEQIGSRSGIYRPILMLSAAADQKLFGNDPSAFHRTNVLLHVIATLLVFGFLRSLLASARSPEGKEATGPFPDWPALLAAALFAAHPVHTDAVNSIFNRSEVLGTMGAVGALWLMWANRVTRPRLAFELGAVIYFAALLCKESAATVPVLYAVLVLTLGREASWRARLKALLPIILLLVPLGVYLVLRVRALGSVTDVEVIESATFVQPTFWERLVVTASSARDSLRMLVWPFPFRATYKDYTATLLPLAVAVHAAAAGFFAFSVVRRRALGFAAGLAFVYVAILPSTRLFTNAEIAVPLAERFAYLPSVGLSIAAAFLLAAVRGREPLAASAVAVLAIVGICLPVCRARNDEWRSNISLFEADYRNSPDDGDTVRLLANAYLGAGRNEEVAALCDKHLEGHRGNATLLINCAVAYDRTKRYRDAELAYIEAGKSTTRSVPHANLAALYLKLGDRVHAEEQFLEAVKEESLPAMQHLRRARMLLALYANDAAKLREAISELEQALALRPRMQRAAADLEFAKRKLGEIEGTGGRGAPSCNQPQRACGQAAPPQNSCRPAQPSQNSCRPAQPSQNSCRPAQPSQNSCGSPQPSQNSCRPAQPSQNSCRPAEPPRCGAKQ
jgi:tetratricopeptide (TPR) repeat protein